MNSSPQKRPGTVTLVVVLMYLVGVSEIAFGIVTIFARYGVDARAEDQRLVFSLLGAALILFGLFVIMLASGVARGSRFSRAATTTIMTLGLAADVVGYVADPGGGWSSVLVQGIACVVVFPMLWLGAGARYFAKA